MGLQPSTVEGRQLLRLMPGWETVGRGLLYDYNWPSVPAGAQSPLLPERQLAN